MLALKQCPTCEMEITDQKVCLPNILTEEPIREVELDQKMNHEVESLSGKFHDRTAEQKALSNLEYARTYFDVSKLRISFNR